VNIYVLSLKEKPGYQTPCNLVQKIGGKV